MNRLGKSLRKGRKNKGAADVTVGEVQEVHVRTVNWTHAETDLLLDAAKEVQLHRTKIDLNFTKAEFTELHRIFCQKSTTVPRTLENLRNRLTTLKREYNIFNDLASRSGWSWCPVNHVPIPPDAETLRLLCQSDSRFAYYDKKNFPWYEKMRRMCGGRQASGRRVREAFLSEHSTVGSRTDSSDDPGEEGNERIETESTVQGGNPVHDIGSHDSPTPTSVTSGSGKRTSDEAGMSKREKIKRRISAKGKGIENMADIGKEMVNVHKEIAEVGRRGVQFRETRREKMERATQKLISMDLSPHLTNAIQDRFDKEHHVEYFLNASREAIIAWIQPPAQQQNFGVYPNYTLRFPPTNLNQAFPYFGINPNPPPS